MGKASRLSYIELLIALAGFFLLLCCVYQRVLWILTPYPHSSDGFYYLQELKTRLTTGTGYYTRTSAYFSFFTFIGKAFELSAAEIFRWLTLLPLFLLSLSFSVPFFKLCKVSQSGVITSRALLPLIALIPWSSDIIFYRVYAFPRQALALTLFLFAISLFTSFRQNRFAYYLSLGALLASASLHLLATTAAVCLLTYAMLCITPSLSIRIMIFSAGTALISILTYLSDKSIFVETFPTPLPGWVIAANQAQCSAREWGEMILTALFCLYLLLLLYRGKLNHSAILLTLLYILFNLPIWENEGLLASRLAFISPLFIIAALALSSQPAAVLFTTLLLILQLLPQKDYSRKDSPIRKLISQQQTIRSWIPENASMRADHGLQFMLSYVLDRKAEKQYPSRGMYYELVRGNTKFRQCFSANQVVANIDSFSCFELGDGWLILKRQSRK